jgi:hypothetical protein
MLLARGAFGGAAQIGDLARASTPAALPEAMVGDLARNPTDLVGERADLLIKPRQEAPPADDPTTAVSHARAAPPGANSLRS